MNNNIRRGYLGVASVAIIGMTLSFARQDLAWSGEWTVVSRPIGKKSAIVSAPWPSDHWLLKPNGITVIDPSVYLSVHVPRRFDSLAVTVDVPDETKEIFFAVESEPNTLRYTLVPMNMTDSTHSRWRAVLDLSNVDQHRGLVNMVIRIPGASVVHPVAVSSVEMRFLRPKRTLASFVQSLWSQIL